MKRFLLYIVLLISAVAAGGCSRHRVIPENKLRRITEEMFLANAYVMRQNVRVDSIDIYTPILKRYGYTQEDFFYTLADFQKRKSARFSDVIEEAVTALQSLSDAYDEKVRDIAYIDSLALAGSSREVLSVKQIKVTRMSDTSRLRLSIPVQGGRQYEIRYVYCVDSLDKNNMLQSTQIITDRNGARNYYYRDNLLRMVRKPYKNTFTPQEGSVKYTIQLADYTTCEERPYITVDSLVITRFEPIEKALARMDSLMRFRPGIMSNDSIRVTGTLKVEIPFLPTEADSLKTKLK